MARAASKTPRRQAEAIQVNFRLEPPLYEAVGAVAREEGRTIAQAARRLMEEGLRRRTRSAVADGIEGEELAILAEAGGAFDWLADEPDLYDDDSGEPL